MSLRDKLIANLNRNVCTNCKHFEIIGNAWFCKKKDKLLLQEFIDCDRSVCCEHDGE